MTVIVCERTKNGVIVMGADSRYTGDDSISTAAVPKIKRIGNFLVGMAGDVGLGELILGGFVFPEPYEEDSLSAHFQLVVRRKLQNFLMGTRVMDDHGNLNCLRGEELDLLVVYDNRVWQISLNNPDEEKDKGSSLVITECSMPFAIGSGADYCLGALLALQGKTEQRIKQSIQITAKLCNSVDDMTVVIKYE